MRKASFNDKNVAVTILYSAFVTETFPNSINFVVKQDERRLERIYHLMEYQFNKALLFGEVFLSDNQECCVLFLDSERKRTTLRTVLWDIALAVKCTGIRNAFNVIKREKILKQHHPKTPFLHLWTMGTTPESRGKGIGSRLLLEVLDYYGSTKPVYLETTTERNRSFYKKLGFEIFDETNVLGYPLYFLLKNEP